MKVGFIGLGAMGRPMAGHLLAAGHELSVWARREETALPLMRAGAGFCATPTALAAAVEVVFVCVTASEDVQAVTLGPDGLAHGAHAGLVVVDHSTIAPATAREIAAQLEQRGVGFLDAPVSGGAVGAQNATLAVMAGGDGGVLARVRELLACFAKTVVHVGPSGAGQVAKACNQLVMVAAIQACAEAVALARAHGLDFATVREALLAGSAGSRVLDVFGARMARRDFAAGVEARLHHKDFALLMAEAVARGVPLPVAAQVEQQLNALMAHGWGGEDTSVLLRLLEP